MVESMSRIWIRMAAVLAAVAAAVSCATSAVEYVGSTYYFYGPDAALEVLDKYEVLPEDRALAEVERAMALLELGRYAESFAALSRAEFMLDRLDEEVLSGFDHEAPPWRPESHERVMISTLQIANSLAMHDMGAAAEAADRAVSDMADAACDSCRFTFTRVLAALAYEGAGRHTDGRDLLALTTVEGRGLELVEELQRRLARGVAGDEPAGWAPPPVEGDRTLEVVLLLGRGPYKEVDKLAVTESETIRWCRYLPRDPQAVTWAALEVEDPVISVELTAVEDLAVASLGDRAGRVVAERGAGVDPKSYDLRHWESLPASLQILNFELPPFLDTIDLVFYSPEGYEVDRETIQWPDDWTGGRLFVIRRMP